MTARLASPFDFEPRAPRLSRKTTLIVAVSLGVHACVAAYLALMQFAPPQAVAIPEPPAIEIENVTLPKTPPETPPPPDQPHKQIIVHETPTPPISSDVAPMQIEKPPQIASIDIKGPPSIAPPADPPQPPTPPDIRNPTWLRQPGAAEMARFYPDRAMRMEVTGKATLSCAVTASGTVDSCRVVGETPADMGFGPAAVKLSEYFKMVPRTVDGRPVEGGQVVIPIRFNLG
jgi:protein TonB